MNSERVDMMKTATQKIMNSFPMLEKYLPDHDSALLSDEVLSKLSDTEQVFLQMAWFIEAPDKENFNLKLLFNKVDKDWLGFALETINVFFEKDTYLLEEMPFSVITENSMYYNQSDFAAYLSQHGLRFSRAKVNMYWNRGKLPNPDITVSGIPYWELTTCESYLKGFES